MIEQEIIPNDLENIGEMLQVNVKMPVLILLNLKSCSQITHKKMSREEKVMGLGW